LGLLPALHEVCSASQLQTAEGILKKKLMLLSDYRCTNDEKCKRGVPIHAQHTDENANETDSFTRSSGSVFREMGNPTTPNPLQSPKFHRKKSF
jgi:hypothetical protein